MCDYPFFIPQVVLFANSSLFWFKVTNEHREFRNYLIKYVILSIKITATQTFGLCNCSEDDTISLPKYGISSEILEPSLLPTGAVFIIIIQRSQLINRDIYILEFHRRKNTIRYPIHFQNRRHLRYLSGGL